MSILNEIFEHKRTETASRRQALPLADVRAAARAAPDPLDFERTLKSAPVRPALIAEVKQASPSRGQLRPQGASFDAVALAHTYADNGASAISVLTDEKYFQGSLETLRAVRAALPAVPLLRKDFICDPYQVYEARAAGADAVLLIVAALDSAALVALQSLARSLGMASLVEVHSREELATALSVGPDVIGINNRNLKDLSVSLDVTAQLANEVPSNVCLVSESGIFGAGDIARLKAGRGIDAILVGEALVTAPNVADRVRELSGRGV